MLPKTDLRGNFKSFVFIYLLPYFGERKLKTFMCLYVHVDPAVTRRKISPGNESGLPWTVTERPLILACIHLALIAWMPEIAYMCSP